MKIFYTAIMITCFLTGCSGSPFKSEHYLGYSCEGMLAPYNSYCLETNQKKVHPDVAVWMKKSKAMAKQKNWSEVIRMTSVAISIDPLYADSYALRSRAYLEKEFRENALADAETALKLDAGNYEALNNRGLYHLRVGTPLKAKEDFKKSCQGGLENGCANMKLFIDNNLKKAEEALNNKDWDNVIRFTSEIAENEVALAIRGGAYANKKQYAEAINDCETAIKMKPDLAMAYNNKGYALELLGRKKEAGLNYEFACNLKMPSGCANRKRLSMAE